VKRLVDLIGKDQARYRLSPEGRLSFSPQSQDWEGLIPEVIGFLQAIQ
jgi:hypothetical protein